MENYYSPILFAGVLILSQILLKVFNFINNRFDGFSLKKCFKNYRNYRLMRNDLYWYKYKKLHDKAFYYYLNLCVNNAFNLAYDLASKDLKRVAKEKRVNLLYDKFFREKTAV